MKNRNFEAEKVAAIAKVEKEEAAHNYLASLDLLSDNCIYYDTNNGFGFGWKRAVTLEEARNILSKIPASKELAIIKYASGEPTNTASPFLLKIDNYDHTNTIKISYLSESGYKVSIEVKDSEYSRRVMNDVRQKGKHLGFGRYETKRILKFTVFGLVNWSGDGQTVYSKDVESTPKFEYMLFNGNIQY